jgi:alkylation response protein AidB-like acyl-CoA dehydrogenase
MDFDDSSEEAAYRDQVRTFLAEHDDQLEHGGGEQLSRPGEDSTAQLRHSQAVLYSGGLVGVTWPSEYGGQGGTPAQQAIVNQELARADIAPLINHIGVGICGPTVVHHGSEDQKNRYLARLLRADDIWCQLFSEPDPAATSPHCAPVRFRTRTGAGASPARRCGPPTLTWPVTASSWPGRIRSCPSIEG